MFARNFLISVKPMKHQEFHEAIANQVLDLMSRQEGFMNVITFADASGNGVTATMVWDTKAHAERFEELALEQVAEVLDPYMDGTLKPMGNCTVYSARADRAIESVQTPAPAETYGFAHAI